MHLHLLQVRRCDAPKIPMGCAVEIRLSVRSDCAAARSSKVRRLRGLCRPDLNCLHGELLGVVGTFATRSRSDGEPGLL